MKSLNGVAVVAAWVAIATARGLTDNLMVNGSFEAGGSGVCDGNNADQLQAWSFSSSCSIDWVRVESCPSTVCVTPGVPQGACFIDLAGSCHTHGQIWQWVSVVPDTLYRLTFAVGANCNAFPAVKPLSVMTDGTETLLEVECAGGGCFEWDGYRSIEFVASTENIEIRFASVVPGNPNYGPLIDDVRLVAVPDCDSNGISDADEIAAGAADLNGNGIPDTCECIADLTGNGEVNGADISVLLGFWGKVPKPLPAADINQDGVVNGLDLGVLLGNWGPCQ